jgi:hypothetical protein
MIPEKRYFMTTILEQYTGQMVLKAFAYLFRCSSITWFDEETNNDDSALLLFDGPIPQSFEHPSYRLCPQPR